MNRTAVCLSALTTFVLASGLHAQTFALAKPTAVGLDSMLTAAAFRRAGELAPLNSLLIARDGKLVGERYYRGLTRDRAVNVKSASKSVLNALLGIAVQQGKLRLDQTIEQVLPAATTSALDPRTRAITIRQLMMMKAGLESTSFDNYGAWVNSANWVNNALRRPFTCAPDTCMVYSTGNTHLLSVILTRATGLSTRDFANRYLFGPLGTQIAGWTRDPQGYYLGGNEMNLTPRQMLRLGQLYLDGGAVDGKQLLTPAWIQDSWGEYATSPWNGHRYGLLWWSRDSGPYKVHFAWGYGGQFIFVVPQLKLVAVMTSSLTASRNGRHNDALHRLVDEYLIPAATGSP
jgi:CubicO group peptidase (beta-lactamase class C family)